MAGEIRSSGGCWTCKLRKKKCTEEKPACTVCSSLRLECGSYGPRPDWMDGGVKEKEKLARLREAVKNVTSQRKRAAMKRRHKHAQEEEAVLVDPPQYGRLQPQPTPTATIPPQQKSSSPQQDIPLLIDGPPLGHTPENTVAYIAQNESVLLMHYLDYVFPCQFRLYRPSLKDGGRGWLLSLLMQTKPLYYAACSLAAYHRQMQYCLQGGKKKGCFQIEALQTQYDTAITELRRYLEVFLASDRQRTLAEDVQLLGSIVLLVSIEGFISNTKTWHIHLAAALSIFPDINKRIRDITLQGQGTSSHRAALSFFTTLLSWYSMVSCATIGWELSAPCSHEIEPDFIPFDKIIGCENWVMFLIYDIIILEKWKKEQKANGRLSVRELVSRGNEIESRLNSGLENTEKEKKKRKKAKSMHNERSLDIDDTSVNSSVTRVYYFAASVYLHVIISGAFPNLPEIRHPVVQSMEALKALPDPELVNNLIWPFCITSCMALEKDQDFFKNFSHFGNQNDGKFGASKVRVIMEECWRLRRLDPGSGEIDWRAAMHSLEFHILLV